MDCTCNVAKRMLTPGVINIKQLENGTDVVNWTLSSKFCPESGNDFTQFDAFLVLQHGDGRTDEVLLVSKENDDGTITLTWQIGKYATWLKRHVKYQIVFRNKCRSELSVIMPDVTTPEHGAYSINDRNVEGFFRIWTHKTNKTCTIQYNNTLQRWELLNGAAIVSYQKVPHFEPYGGTWESALVGNATAYAWRSAEAVIYVSESIAADEDISAQCPTILRQVFDGMQNICSKSGVTALTDWVYSTYWYGFEAPYYINLHEQFNIPAGCPVVDVRVQRENEDGTFTDVDSVAVVESDGEAKLYITENVDCKVTISIRSAGGSYVFVDEKSVGHVGGWRIDAPGIATDLSNFDTENAGFVFYATDTGMYYRKQSNTSGDWSEPYPFRGEQGVPGEQGRPGIDGVSEVYVYNAIDEHDKSADAHADLFAAVANGQTATNADIAALAERVTTNEADITAIMGVVDTNATSIAELAERVTTNETNIAAVAETLDGINAALAAIVGE